MSELLTILRRKKKKSAALPWYLLDGVDPYHCKGAYAARGAASQAASYINLVNPGVHDLTATSVPTWDNINGWRFYGVQYLKTGIVPTSANWSMFIRYSGITGSGYQCLMGVMNAGYSLGFALNRYSVSNVDYFYATQSAPATTPSKTSGVRAISNRYGYYNGVPISTQDTDGGMPTGSPDIWIGGAHIGAGMQFPIQFYVQAVAIYDTII